MWTKTFWTATAERTIRTFAQAFAAFLAAGATGLLTVDWVQAASVSGLAALLCLLTCIAAGTVDADTGASFGPEQPRPALAVGDRPVMNITGDHPRRDEQ